MLRTVENKSGLPHPSTPRLRRVRNDIEESCHHEERERRGDRHFTQKGYSCFRLAVTFIRVHALVFMLPNRCHNCVILDSIWRSEL